MGLQHLDREPRPAPAGVGVAFSRAGLLATKLFVPAPLEAPILRQQLLKRLDQALDRRLTLISAPAGFGKTTLVAHWVRARQGQPGAPTFCWLSLDAQDNDPGRFLNHLLAALPEGGGTAGRLAERIPPAPPEQVAAALVNEVSQSPWKVVLVLDDYHLISAPPVHSALLFLIEHLPPQLHLVLCSRSDPPLLLSRWRVRNQLVELRAADLRFDAREAAAFFSQAVPLSLSDSDVQRLVARTEGWIAGLQLAALSLRGLDVEGAAGFIAAFGGSNRLVASYLTEEVVQRQPPDVQAFLLDTAILERLCTPLCVAVTGNPAAGELLARLRDENIFVAPLDYTDTWFRYHALFAEALRSRLEASAPERVAQLHRRAAHWYAAHELPGYAVDHARATGDLALVADLVEAAADRLWTSGNLTLLTGWLDELPHGELQARPGLLILHAWLFFLADRWTDAEQAVAQASHVLATRPVGPATQTWHGQLAAVQGAMAAHRQQPAATVRHMEEALDALGQNGGPWWHIAIIGLGLAQLSEGAALRAMTTFRQAAEQCSRDGDLYLAFAAWWHFIESALAQGELQQVADALLRLEHLGERDPQGRLALPDNAAVGRGILAFEQDELAEATAQLRAGLARVWPGGQPRVALAGFLALAQTLQAQNDPVGAQTQLAIAARLVRNFQLQAEQALVSALGARLALVRGDWATLQQWQRNLPPEVGAEAGFAGEFVCLTLVRTWLAEGKASPARRLLEQLRDAAHTVARTRSLIEIDLLRALALHQLGRTDAALDCLQASLMLAEPEGIRQIFVQEGTQLAPLLRRVQPRTPFVHSLLLRMAPEPETQNAPDALTPREVEILELVSTGLTNQQIAEELFITVGTVKGHLNHIYGKLGVQNRTQAILRGRELGLLAG